MMQLRAEFRQIVAGWMLVDFPALRARLEKLAEWSKNNSPLLPAEHAIVQLMLETQMVQGFAHGFDYDLQDIEQLPEYRETAMKDRLNHDC